MFDRVTEYAKEVVAGKYVVGNLHKLSCARHLNDLKKQETKEFPYFWSVEMSERILVYAETLSTIEGFDKKQIKLLGFQIFDIGCRFGWLNKNHKRRFRRSYKSMAKQNGKTFENGIIGTYIAGFSGYQYGKIFTVATKKRQAKLAWDEMMKFIKADADLGEHFNIKEYKTMITALNTDCTIEALSREAGLDDGFRSIFSSVDELHQHPNNQIYKMLYNGTKSLPETLVSMITTRGDRLSSFAYEMDTYAINILEGVVKAEDFFVDIYALDKKDNIFDTKNLIKANPYLATTEIGMESLLTDMQTAKDMGGSDLRDFIIKSLNMWSRNAEDHFTTPELWKKGESNNKISEYKGKDAYVGLDLSKGGDLTTLHIKIPLEANKSYEYSHSFMPKGRLEEHIATDTAPYDLWEQIGLITITGDSASFKNDYKFIIKKLKEILEENDLNLRGIGYDPHNADAFLADLEVFGVPMLQITQSARFLNDGTVDMQLNIKSGNVEYDKENELLTWSIINSKIVKNSFDEKKIDKEPKKLTKRIDPADAMINADITFMKLSEEEVIDEAKEMNKYLEMMGWKKDD